MASIKIIIIANTIRIISISYQQIKQKLCLKIPTFCHVDDHHTRNRINLF